MRSLLKVMILSTLGVTSALSFAVGTCKNGSKTLAVTNEDACQKQGGQWETQIAVNTAAPTPAQEVENTTAPAPNSGELLYEEEDPMYYDLGEEE
jgi:hypothetical protein